MLCRVPTMFSATQTYKCQYISYNMGGETARVCRHKAEQDSTRVEIEHYTKTYQTLYSNAFFAGSIITRKTVTVHILISVER